MLLTYKHTKKTISVSKYSLQTPAKYCQLFPVSCPTYPQNIKKIRPYAFALNVAYSQVANLQTSNHNIHRWRRYNN